MTHKRYSQQPARLVRNSSSALWFPVLILLLMVFSRVAALDALPLHNDEGLHLSRAIEVWHLHPFFDIEDGKVAGPWLIALFNPQVAPVFAARIATVFVGLVGCAAGMAVGRIVTKQHTAGVLAGLLWLTAPYIFFFERMALADIEAGAAVVMLVLALLPDVKTGKAVILGGLALGMAILFKVSAAPFVGVPFLALVLTQRQSWLGLGRRLLFILLIALVLVAPAVLYSVSRGGLFSIARTWVSGAQFSIPQRTQQNVQTFADTLVTVDGPWVLALIGMPFSLLAGRRGLYVLGSLLGPLLVMLILGTEVLDRHFGVLLPLMAVVAAVGWSHLVSLLLSRSPSNFESSPFLYYAVIVIIVFLVTWAWGWFWRTAYADPAAIPMTSPMREQYVSQFPSGFGLREAVLAFPQTANGQPIIASMTTDGCRRARFYLPAKQTLTCTGMGEQSKAQIDDALQRAGSIYVLAEDPPIGIDPALIQGKWTEVAVYPRPGNNSKVTLWHVVR